MLNAIKAVLGFLIALTLGGLAWYGIAVGLLMLPGPVALGILALFIIGWAINAK